MAQETAFAEIFEGDEIARFLQQFVLAGEDRARKIAAAPDAGWQAFPDSINAVMDDVRELWRERGFLTPAETQSILLEKYAPHAPQDLLDFMHATALSRNAPDHVTGFLSKEHAYTATGLAHLYATETGKPIAMVEVDFSNMGGTNDYFRRMLAAERGVDESEITGREDRAMTNIAMGLLCASMTHTMAQYLPADAQILPIRTGGDELRILVTGLEDSREIRILADRMHADIEKHIAAMGLQDHPHTKDPANPARNGFGAALAIQDLGTLKNPQSIIQELDGRIKYAKQELGLLRLGKIDAEMVAVSTRAQVLFGENPLAPGQTLDGLTQQRIAYFTAGAAITAEKLHAMNPQYNPALQGGSKGFLQYTNERLELYAPGKLQAPPPPEGMAAYDAAKSAPEPMADLQQRRMATALKKWPDLSPPLRHMLDITLAALNPHDPSAQAMMPQVIAPTIEAYARETAAYRMQFNGKDPVVREALLQAGMLRADIGKPFAMSVSFHNLAGLNNTLGHHYSDVVLRHMTEIIDQSFTAAGLPNSEPKPWVIAHDGGANFTAVIRPGVTDAAGAPKFISAQHLKKAQEEIAARVEALNHTGIAAFMADKGMPVDRRMAEYLRDENIITFADIQDPKFRDVTASDMTIKGQVHGLKVATVQGEIPAGDVKGHVFVDDLRQMCEGRLEMARREAMVLRYVAAVMESRQPALSAEFNAAAQHPDHAGPANPRRDMWAIYSRLPETPDSSMPPEMSTLVQFKAGAADAARHIAAIDSAQPNDGERALWAEREGRALRLFTQQFDEYTRSGSLLQVAAYVQQQPEVQPLRLDTRPDNGPAWNTLKAGAAQKNRQPKA
ncbi:MAG: hypothetical protein PW788_12160 [Micavibrio sp.]|nr:hypothetical protein [Micavibrio sp.]